MASPQPKRSSAPVALSAVATVLLVGTLGLSTFTARRVTASSARVDHTMLVKIAVSDLLVALFEAETGQRGYVLTGRSEYLEPYRRATSDALEGVDRLRLLTNDNETQQALVADIGRLTRTDLDELQQVIDRRNDAGQDAVSSLSDTDLGLHTMDALQRKLEEMTAVEDGLLTLRMHRQRRYESLTLTALVVTSILFGLFAALVALWTRTAEARRQRVESDAARLQAENGMLAQRQRTTEMQERFTAILGHDLRNPLSSVTMGIRLLRKCPPTQQATLDRMASSTARMSRMIDQLLDLTRSRLGGGISLACAPMNLWS